VKEVLLFALSISLSLALLALARETRLRRALERLLRLVLARWRPTHATQNRRPPLDERHRADDE
jgi:hypothetical protein